MKPTPGKHYSLKMNLSGRIVYYTGKVIQIDKKEFRLETNSHKGCRALTLKEKDIISIKEIPEPEREEKVFKISKKKQFKDLKPSVEPDF